MFQQCLPTVIILNVYAVEGTNAFPSSTTHMSEYLLNGTGAAIINTQYAGHVPNK
jgi:hypothetical protein